MKKLRFLKRKKLNLRNKFLIDKNYQKPKKSKILDKALKKQENPFKIIQATFNLNKGKLE